MLPHVRITGVLEPRGTCVVLECDTERYEHTVEWWALFEIAAADDPKISKKFSLPARFLNKEDTALNFKDGHRCRLAKVIAWYIMDQTPCIHK